MSCVHDDVLTVITSESGDFISPAAHCCVQTLALTVDVMLLKFNAQGSERTSESTHFSKPLLVLTLANVVINN